MEPSCSPDRYDRHRRTRRHHRRSRSYRRSRGRSGSRVEPSDELLQPGHPLFLHPSDQTGVLLVSEKLVGVENYASWSRDMKAALNGKNKFGIVDPKVIQPTEDSPLFQAWDRCNGVVLSWLLTALSPEIYKTFTYENDARRVWTHLKEKFQQVGTKEICRVSSNLANAMQNGETVDRYVFRLERLWSQYDSYIEICYPSLIRDPVFRQFREKSKVIEFLNGLDQVHGAARSQIQHIRPPPTLSEAIGMIRDDETAHGSTRATSQTDTLAFQLGSKLHVGSRQQHGGPHIGASSTHQHRGNVSANAPHAHMGSADMEALNGNCAHCGKRGHHMDDCYLLTKCTHCGYVGHPKEKCFKLHGKPEVKGKAKIGKRRSAHHTAVDDASSDDETVLSKEDQAMIKTILNK